MAALSFFFISFNLIYDMREQLDSTPLGERMSKSIIFRLVKRNPKPALKGRFYPSQKRCPTEELIFDEKSGKNRTIRYAPGEQSIYKDEQSTGKVVVGDIVFQNGTLVVPYTNPTLLEYLEKSNRNKSNPLRIRETKPLFKLVDREADAKVTVDTKVDEIRAASMVLGMDFDDMKAYARVLGVNVKNGASMIRHDMIILAEKDPSKFMAGIDDPLVKRQQVILDAMSYRLISVSGRSISWVLGDKESLIVPVPIGQDAVAWFAQWTMNESDGDKVYTEIEKKVKSLSE